MLDDKTPWNAQEKTCMRAKICENADLGVHKRLRGHEWGSAARQIGETTPSTKCTLPVTFPPLCQLRLLA